MTAPTEAGERAKQVRNRWLRLAVSVLLAVVFVGLLLSQVQLADLTELFSRMNLAWVLVAAVAYAAMGVSRGMRFWIMTKRAASPVRLSAIAAAQALLLSILPMRTGEISFVGLLGRERGVGGPWASKILVAVRLLDLAAVCIVFIVALPLSTAVPVAVAAALPFAVAGVIFPLGLLAWPHLIAGLVRRPVIWVVNNQLLGRLPGIPKLAGFLDRTMSVSDPQWFRRMLPILLLLSVAVWTLAACVSYSCLRSIGVVVSGVDAAFMTSVLVLSSVLPIHGLGGYGPQNAIGAGLLMTIGIGKETAIPAHLGWHTLQLIIQCVVGSIGWDFHSYRVGSGRYTLTRRTCC
jgi:uncharacterized membrane protein YbhN (UPF0104 family)